MKLSMSDGMIDHAAEMFRALSEPSRLRLLRLMLEAGEELTQGELAERTGLSQANASKHLASLARAGLVLRSSAGSAVLYRPATPLVGKLCHLVCGHVEARERTRMKGLR